MSIRYLLASLEFKINWLINPSADQILNVAFLHEIELDEGRINGVIIKIVLQTF
jgi:hypothetical protein